MTRFIIKNEQEAKKLGISKGEWELMKMEQKENKNYKKDIIKGDNDE